MRTNVKPSSNSIQDILDTTSFKNDNLETVESEYISQFIDKGKLIIRIHENKFLLFLQKKKD